MIKNYSDLKEYLLADAKSHGQERYSFKSLIFNDIYRFQYCLRWLEYLTNTKRNKVLKLLLHFYFRRLSRNLGFTIPVNVFGAGLAIAHYGTIVINKQAKIGKNCRIHVCVNIGSSRSGGAPVIGDNVYIGPGAKIYGAIKIASGISIGANAVVNKSFEEENVTIVGIPAHVVTKSSVICLN